MRKIQAEFVWDSISGGLRQNPQFKPKKPKTRNTKPTNSLTKAIENFVLLKGGFVARINVSGFYREGLGYVKSGSTVGMSDLVICQNGRYLSVEVKFGKDTQSIEQKAVEAKIVAAGGSYFVAKSLAEFEEFFNSWIKK
jgi:hypothetical protein